MFSVTGPFYRMGTIIYKYLTLNVLFLAFCIPVVTIPAATAGLFAVARKIVYEKEPSIFSVFIQGFKQNFKQSFIVGLIFIPVSIFFVMDYRAAHVIFGGLFMVLWMIAVFVTLSVLVHVYPLMVHMDLTIKHIFLNAIKMTVIKPFLSISSVITALVFTYVSCVIPILFFTFFFSVLATAIYHMVNKKFQVLEIVVADVSEPVNTFQANNSKI